MPSIISIVGKSGSGKTTLIEKLIPELKRRGYRVGTIKHAAHRIDMDKKGKDSWRHMQAGADTVMVVSPETLAMVKSTTDVKVTDLEKYFDDADLVITEGFKSGHMPKIEIFRRAAHRQPLCLDDAQLVAMVTDAPIDPGVPVFKLDEVAHLADLIEARFMPLVRQTTDHSRTQPASNPD